jgi:hypothetical protein
MTNETSGKRPGFFTSPVALLRVSATLFVVLTIGHLSAYPWTSARDPQGQQLVSSMKSVELVFFGEHSTYWNLYFGWGLLVPVLLLTLAVILWLLSDIARFAPQPVGVIAGVLVGTCLIGAVISFRFFYIPPFLTFSVICIILLTAAIQLLRKA